MEAAGTAPAKSKKKAKGATTAKKAAARPRRAKARVHVRKRLLWGVFNGSMKEEARFPYDQMEAAEERMKILREKSPKKLFFIQPIKEEITDTPAPAAEKSEE